MSKMMIGYLAGFAMAVFVYVIVTLAEPTWLAFAVIAIIGGMAGVLISVFGREREG